MNLKFTETKIDVEQKDEFEQLLQAGSCGSTSGGCEGPIHAEPNKK